jgi:hypothetical protein
MRDALQVYEGVLRELDRYGSPNFEVHDFNHFIKKAVDMYVGEMLKVYDITDQVSDELSSLVKQESLVFNPNNTTNVRSATMPDDYLRITNCIVALREKGTGKKDYVKAQRLTGDAYAYIFDNSYFKPIVTNCVKRVYRRIVNGKLDIIYDTPSNVNEDTVVESVTLEYIRKPKAIVLGDDYVSVQGSEFPDNVDQKIISLCVHLVRERNNGATGGNQEA